MVGRSLSFSRVPVVVRAVLGAAALLGLFAMHGLALHGAMNTALHGANDEPAATSMTMSSGHDHHGGALGDGHVGTVHEQAWHESSPAGHHHGESVLALCLAVLLTGVLSALGLSRLAWFRLPDHRAALTLVRPVRTRDHDPPCLFALSIQRC